jgi:hypothetical protein
MALHAVKLFLQLRAEQIGSIRVLKIRWALKGPRRFESGHRHFPIPLVNLEQTLALVDVTASADLLAGPACDRGSLRERLGYDSSTGRGTPTSESENSPAGFRLG